MKMTERLQQGHRNVLTISIEPYCDIYGQIIKTFPFWFFFLTMNQQLPEYIYT